MRTYRIRDRRALVGNSQLNANARSGKFRNLVRCVLGVGSFAMAGILLTTPAFGQLRTGRDSDRDFYASDAEQHPTQAPARKKVPSTQSAKSKAEVKSPVKQASATAPKRSTGSSQVVQAGCKNCQSGAVHSHAPVASSEQTEFAMESADEVVTSPLQHETYDEGSMVLGHSDACHSCEPSFDCDSGNLVVPLGVVGQILRRTQLRIEAATFWPDGQNLPQLVTTRRPANDPNTDGLIGRSDTVNLFGGSEALGGSTQGLRGELGLFFDDAKSHGLMLRFFDAGDNSQSYNSATTTEAVVMRPFFDITGNAQSTIAVNYPGSTSGSADAIISSDLYGGDILLRKMILRDCAGHVEFLAGYQTARLADNLKIHSSTTALTNTPAPLGTISDLTDNFATSNRFNGFALGLSGIMRERAWSLGGMFKLGMGNLERSVAIDGSSTITVPGAPPSVSTTSSGLLARNTNDGTYVMNTFTVSPEVGVTLGYHLSRRLEATVGYTYLGLPKVARVADQLDPQLAANLSNPPSGASRPSFSLLESNFSLHSLNYGLQWRY